MFWRSDSENQKELNQVILLPKSNKKSNGYQCFIFIYPLGSDFSNWTLPLRFQGSSRLRMCLKAFRNGSLVFKWMPFHNTKNINSQSTFFFLFLMKKSVLFLPHDLVLFLWKKRNSDDTNFLPWLLVTWLVFFPTG